MRKLKKKVVTLLLAFGSLWAAPYLLAQTHQYPAEDTNNTFTGSNTFSKTVTAPGITSSTGHVAIGNSLNTAVVTVTYGASTTFNGASGDHFEETLTGDVTSVTTSGFVSGTTYSFKICQDSTGNRAFTAPSIFVGWQPIATSPSSCTTQIGYYDGTDVNFPTAGTSTTSSSSTSNGLIAGCGIIYSGSGLAYSIAACDYQIGGTVYHTGQANVTLAAADPTNDRYDVFYVDNTGSVGAITGTASSTPLVPSVDPASQINIGFVTVTAGSTSPSGVSDKTIYKENVGTAGGEWDCTTSGTDWLCNDNSQPYAGTRNLLSSGLNVSDYVKLAASSATDISSYNVLSLRLETVNAWTGKDEVWLTWYNGTSAVGNTVFTSSSTYGWNGKTTSTYQLVVIPMSTFGIGSSTVDSLRITWNTGGRTATNKTIHMDNIVLQANDVSGGANGSSGGVSSVGMTGDGTIFKTAVTGSPVTSSGTLAPSLVSVPAAHVLAGPIGSSQTNVGIRQSQVCSPSATATSMDCTLSDFGSDPVAGDKWLIWMPASGSCGSPTITDDLGSTFSSHGTSVSCIYTATIASSGSTQIHFTSMPAYASCATYHCAVAIVAEVAGMDAYVNDAVEATSGSPYTNSTSITPGASTDALIRFAFDTSGNDSTAATGNTTLNPTGSAFLTFTSGDTGNAFGTADIYAPGSTSSSSSSVTFNVTAGGGGSNKHYLAVVDLSQSSSAGSSPPTYRRITEGDLPASAKTAIQSVNRYSVSSPVAMDSGGATTNVLQETLTMPSDGCPCRVEISYSGIINSTSSGTWTSWVTDGTDDYATTQSITTDGHAPPLTATDFSASYGNNESVTFTWKANAGTFGGTETMEINSAAASSTSSQGSWMTLAVMQSQN